MAIEYIDPARVKAQESYWGKQLTQSQFDSFWPMTEIMNRTVRRSGSFNNELTDFAHASARNERMDAVQAETVIRDLYKIRYGETLNATRERLVNKEQAITGTAHEQGLHAAKAALQHIKDGPTTSFLATDHSAVKMATQHGISEAGAKRIMSTSYERAEGRSLYDAGKEQEDIHYRPVKEAERTQRQTDAFQKRQSVARAR